MQPRRSFLSAFNFCHFHMKFHARKYQQLYTSKNMLGACMVCGVDVIGSSVLLILAMLQCLWFQQVTESDPKLAWIQPFVHDSSLCALSARQDNMKISELPMKSCLRSILVLCCCFVQMVEMDYNILHSFSRRNMQLFNPSRFDHAASHLGPWRSYSPKSHFESGCRLEGPLCLRGDADASYPAREDGTKTEVRQVKQDSKR